MTTQSIKIGQQFKQGHFNKAGELSFSDDTIYTVYQITPTRVCYTDGIKHSAGSTNRRVKGSWMTTEGFAKKIENGSISLI